MRRPLLHLRTRSESTAVDAGCRSGGTRQAAPAPRRSAAAQARHPGRRRGQGSQEDPVLGDGHAQPAAAVGVHVRPRPDAEGAGRPRRRSARAPRSTPSNCSTCHGANGEGGLGYQFADGEVLKTFPQHRGPAAVRLQRHAAVRARRHPDLRRPQPRGRPAHRPCPRHHAGAGPRGPGGGLTDAQILAVVCHERFTLGGADQTGATLEEFEKWCSPEAPAWEGLEDGRADLREHRRRARGHPPRRHRAGSRQLSSLTGAGSTR